MSTSSSFSLVSPSAGGGGVASSSSSPSTNAFTTSASPPPTTSQSNAFGLSSSTFFPFSPPSSSITSSPIPQITSSPTFATQSASAFSNLRFQTSPSLSVSPLPQSSSSPSSPSLAPTPQNDPTHIDAQSASNTNAAWSPGEIALIAVCSFLLLLAVVACVLVVFVRRRAARRDRDRERDFAFDIQRQGFDGDNGTLRPGRESIGSVEKFGYGYGYTTTTGGGGGGGGGNAKGYIAGAYDSTAHKNSLSGGAEAEAETAAEAEAEDETRGTAPLLSRKIRPVSSRLSLLAVYGDGDGDGDARRRSLYENEGGLNDELEPSSPALAVPLLASTPAPPIPPIPQIPPAPFSPPPQPHSHEQQELMRDLQSVQNLFAYGYGPQQQQQQQPQQQYSMPPVSRRSSRTTRRGSRRAFASASADASTNNAETYMGYDSDDDSASMYSQASAPASVSAPSLLSSKSVRSVYARPARTGVGQGQGQSQGLIPAPASLSVGGLPPIPQSPFAPSVYESRSGGESQNQSQRQSVATIRPSVSASQVSSFQIPLEVEGTSHARAGAGGEDELEDDQEKALADPEHAIRVAKLLQIRQRNAHSLPLFPPRARASPQVSSSHVSSESDPPAQAQAGAQAVVQAQAQSQSQTGARAPETMTRSSSLVSQIERSGSIRPVLQLPSVQEGGEPGSGPGSVVRRK